MNKLIEKIVEKIECLQGQAKKGYDTYGKEAYAGKHDAYTVALNIIQEEAKAYNEVKTNADRIRSMTDEELAEMFTKLAWNSEVQTTPLKYLDWLKAERER